MKKNKRSAKKHSVSKKRGNLPIGKQNRSHGTRAVGVLGVGQMGEAIASRLAEAGGYAIQGTTRSLESAAAVTKRTGIPCSIDNIAVAKSSRVLVLAMKPHQIVATLDEIKAALKPGMLVISIAAGITTEALSQALPKGVSAIRAMPNTPSLIGEGMTVLVPAEGTPPAHVEEAKEIFSKLGRVSLLEESLMDGATGLSGCGPAYGFLIIEALAEAGVKVGLPRDVATLFSAQTLLGAAKMVLERGVHPAELKDEVTTPAGCTIEGLMALEEGKLRVTLLKAVIAATERSRSLRKA